MTCFRQLAVLKTKRRNWRLTTSCCLGFKRTGDGNKTFHSVGESASIGFEAKSELATSALSRWRCIKSREVSKGVRLSLTLKGNSNSIVAVALGIGTVSYSIRSLFRKILSSAMMAWSGDSGANFRGFRRGVTAQKAASAVISGRQHSETRNCAAKSFLCNTSLYDFPNRILRIISIFFQVLR